MTTALHSLRNALLVAAAMPLLLVAQRSWLALPLAVLLLAPVAHDLWTERCLFLGHRVCRCLVCQGEGVMACERCGTAFALPGLSSARRSEPPSDLLGAERLSGCAVGIGSHSQNDRVVQVARPHSVT